MLHWCYIWKNAIQMTYFQIFSNEIAKYGKVLISIFQQFFASINKVFILDGRLGSRL